MELYDNKQSVVGAVSPSIRIVPCLPSQNSVTCFSCVVGLQKQLPSSLRTQLKEDYCVTHQRLLLHCHEEVLEQTLVQT